MNIVLLINLKLLTTATFLAFIYYQRKFHAEINMKKSFKTSGPVHSISFTIGESKYSSSAWRRFGSLPTYRDYCEDAQADLYLLGAHAIF